MDIKSKINAIEFEDQEKQRQCKENLFLRNKLADLDKKYKEMRKQRSELERSATQLNSQILQVQCDLKLLDRQRDEIENYVKNKENEIQKYREELINSKSNYKNAIRDSIRRIQNTIKQVEKAAPFDKTGTHLSNNHFADNDIIMRKQWWAVQGEIEALELYINFQENKLKEIENIKKTLEDVIEYEN